MAPTYDWACPHGHSFTARAGMEDMHRLCVRCDETANRVQVYRVNSTGFAKVPPGKQDLSREYKAYDEASQEIVYKSERAGVDPPPLVQMAKARVGELRKKGVTSASDIQPGRK